MTTAGQERKNMTSTGTLQIENALTLSAAEVRALLPQREPFLFVDDVPEVVPGVRVIAHVTYPADSPFYSGHFPGSPLTPGVIIIETMAQAASLIMLTTPRYKGQVGYFVGIREARFFRPVHPGEAVLLEGSVTSQRHGVIEVAMQATVAGVRAATAVLTVTFRPRPLDCGSADARAPSDTREV
jgi:3-hydroxyacyl-[acyl-carrier-protein] dehydratase